MRCLSYPSSYFYSLDTNPRRNLSVDYFFIDKAERSSYAYFRSSSRWLSGR